MKEDRGMTVVLGLEEKRSRISAEGDRERVIRCVKGFLVNIWAKR